MAQPINLNRARKQRARQKAREAADRNAALHGLPKAEKRRAKAEAELEARRLDAGRLDRDDSGTPD